MNILVFDTETAGSFNKPFCYNIGYVIYDTETDHTLVSKDFVVEQVWHNDMLFTSAYYADKRPLYVNRMRARQTKMSKFGYICREMARDIENFNVTSAYAYNSPFDDNVFKFNCDWYKCINPFDNIPIFDIRGYVHEFLIDNKYKEFCETYKFFTESGNYSTTAETVFRYVSYDLEFNEEHTALADSKIELEILIDMVRRGAKLETAYPVKMSIKREVEKELEIIVDRKQTAKFKYISKTCRDNKIFLKTK